MKEHSVLYRKYRPQTFKDVVGQEHVVRTLKNALSMGKVAHAYLFTGPRGTGKTTIARILAYELNKKTPDASYDLIEIDAASNRGVDEIRALREGVRVGPSQGEYKIYLVDEVHMLTKEAFNAFLKTLEEPPPFVVFVLATTEPHKLPETIISRTQRFDFRRLTILEIVGRLKQLCKNESVDYKEEALVQIAVEAEGSLRDAESLLGQVISFSKASSVDPSLVEEILGVTSFAHLSEFADLLLSRSKDVISWLNHRVESGQDVPQLTKGILRYLRYLMFISLGEELSKKIRDEVDENTYALMKEQSLKTSVSELREFLISLSQAQKELYSYPLPHMALEVALAEFIS